MPAVFEQQRSIFEIIAERDVLLHHPYESFEPVVEFVQAAADPAGPGHQADALPDERAASPVIAALERAAQNGKQVTALVELRAAVRGGAEHRLGAAPGGGRLPGPLRRAPGLKTHAKVCLIVRREAAGVRRYVHLSHRQLQRGTARLYEDLGLPHRRRRLRRRRLGALQRHHRLLARRLQWRRFEVAPEGLLQRLLDLIERETRRPTRDFLGLILAKMNSLAEPRIIEALYRASRAGVRIKLNVRGICCLRPGVPRDLATPSRWSPSSTATSNTRASSTSSNGGDSEVYLSSADWMPRNLGRRIEVMWPVRGPGGEGPAHRRAGGVLRRQPQGAGAAARRQLRTGRPGPLRRGAAAGAPLPPRSPGEGAGALGHPRPVHPDRGEGVTRPGPCPAT